MTIDNVARANELRSANNHRINEIDRLLAAENDPKERGTLIVLSSINLCLVAHTELVIDHGTQITRHMENFEKQSGETTALINQAKGMWRVVAVLLVVGQGLAAASWYGLNARWDAMQQTQATLERQMAILEAMVPAIKSKGGT